MTMLAEDVHVGTQQSRASSGGDVAQTLLPGAMPCSRGRAVGTAICPEITAAHLKIIH